ncbi:MAG: DJ-1/PfpI family protein [Thermomicrobiales bacterium]|nr:DJ-1/PfpI family protein [Thermomicrobiales bacterium]
MSDDLRPLSVGIVVFDGVEVLDFCGPFEVFATAATPVAPGEPEQLRFRVSVLAERSATIRCTGGLLVQPHGTLADSPPLDAIVMPGGVGARREATNPVLLDWLRARYADGALVTSVCTGAEALAAAGLLDGRRATTHWASIDRLRAAYPAVAIRDDARFVDEGDIITAAGVSAGIDMALHVVARLCGPETARWTARLMEYGVESAKR